MRWTIREAFAKPDVLLARDIAGEIIDRNHLTKLQDQRARLNKKDISFPYFTKEEQITVA
ncbi:MAG: hypothetical protein ACJ0Q6_00540 [Candidatus Azotimanducaceae bacterium]|uniref:Uncharacterized protein n=1 Tax=OM182 bacterium TaxID=2510334 RepID=A0A520RZT1_9GAMM|nr:hypothetical protein [Gammaproteobacteria bacterium]RZO75732.1 MAG: hypothetical protein EVA68_06275 [OM182 bacterium]